MKSSQYDSRSCRGIDLSNSCRLQMEGSLLCWLRRRVNMVMLALILLGVGVSSAVEPVTSVVC